MNIRFKIKSKKKKLKKVIKNKSFKKKIKIIMKQTLKQSEKSAKINKEIIVNVEKKKINENEQTMNMNVKNEKKDDMKTVKKDCADENEEKNNTNKNEKKAHINMKTDFNNFY